MVTETRTRITKEMLEEYLPYRLKYAPEKDSTGRLQEAYRTYLETPSQSKTHLAVNIEKQVYYNFKWGEGGNLVGLMRQLGAPISQDLAKSNPRLSYKRQLAILAHNKSEGRYCGCGKRTAIKTNIISGVKEQANRVMCLRWNCTKCAEFLKRVWIEHLADYHCGAIYVVPIGYKGMGKALNRIKQKARRVGAAFDWWLLRSNELQILFVDSRSDSKVKEWLDGEAFFQLVALMPTIEERNRWLERGLEQMNTPMAWNHKVRHSKGIKSIKANVDDVNNTRREYITLSTREYWDLEMIKTRLFEVLTQQKHKVQVDKALGFKKIMAWLVGGWGTHLEPYGMLELRMYEDGETLLLCDATVDKSALPTGRWDTEDKTLEELVAELESQGYTADWLTDDIVRFIPPEGSG